MLLSKTQVIHAMELNRDQVVAALEAGGYESSDILTAEFSGVTVNGHFCYEITYDPPGDEPGRGFVYLNYRRAEGSNDFHLEGEY